MQQFQKSTVCVEKVHIKENKGDYTKGGVDYAGGGVISGSGALRLAAAQVGGGAVPGSTHGSRYAHPGMGTFMPVLSAALFHPLPADTLFAETVGAASVGIGPVGV